MGGPEVLLKIGRTTRLLDSTEPAFIFACIESAVSLSDKMMFTFNTHSEAVSTKVRLHQFHYLNIRQRLTRLYNKPLNILCCDPPVLVMALL